MRHVITPVLAAFCLAFGLSYAFAATADPGTAPAAEVVRGPGAACVDADGPAGPAPCIQSPLDNPRESFDTVMAAKRLGWPVVAFVVGFFALILASRWVPYLKSGKRALAISGATSIVAAAANAGLDGGNWSAMLVAAAGVALALVQPDRTVAAQVKAGGQ